MNSILFVYDRFLATRKIHSLCDNPPISTGKSRLMYIHVEYIIVYVYRIYYIQRSGGIGDKKTVLPWVIGDTSVFGKRFANQNRNYRIVTLVYKYSYKKVAPGTRDAH